MAKRTKKAIMAELDELKVEYDANATAAELEKLIPEGDEKEEKEDEVIPEQPEDMDKEAKNFAAPNPDPEGKGNPDVEKSLPGLKNKVVTPEELQELEKDGRLYGYNSLTKEAAYWPKKK